MAAIQFYLRGEIIMDFAIVLNEFPRDSLNVPVLLVNIENPVIKPFAHLTSLCKQKGC